MLTQAQVDTAHDHEPEPCETCDGTGWIMDNEDLYSPCDVCEASDAAVRTELDAELDAIRWYQEQCEALEARDVARAAASEDRADWERVVVDIVPW